MRCFLSCLLSALPAIVLAAIVGAVLGGMGGTVVGCLAVGGILGGSVGGPGGSLGGFVACEAVSLIALFPYVLAGAIVGAVIAAGIVGLIALVYCGALCASSASSSGTSGAIQGIGEVMPVGAIACAQANSAVDDLAQQLADAEAARGAQQAVVNARGSAVNTARNALILSTAALAAAPFWNPVAVAVAAVAVATSLSALVAAEARFITETIKLAELEAKVAALTGAVEAATAMRDGLCGTDDDSDDGGGRPGTFTPPEVTVGTIG